MENNDLTKALLKAQGIQEFQDGGAPYSGPLRWETGAVITDAEKINFITALLRKETGAVISDSEMAWADQTYFPQMGDSAITVEEKRQAREQAAQQMEQSGDPRSAGFGQRMRQGIGIETGAAIPDSEKEAMLRRQLEQMMRKESGAVPPPENLDPAQEIQQAIESLQIQKAQTTDPDEIKVLDHLIESAAVGLAAPLGGMAAQVQMQGRGEDTALAHLRPGEVIIPPEAFEDERFESVVNKKFEELGIDPETAVSSIGIASLNPITGLEEFGFFSKLWKKTKKVLKKVVKPVAKVAQFIPGPWQPAAALIDKAFTVYDVAKGRASPLSLMTVAGPTAVGGTLGQNISAIKGATGSGSFLKGLGSLGQQSIGSVGSSLQNLGTGIGGLFVGGGKDSVGNFGRIGDFFGGVGDAIGLTNYGGGNYGTPGIAGGDMFTGGGIMPNNGAGRIEWLTGGGRDNVGNFGRVGDFFGGVGDAIGLTNYAAQAQGGGVPYYLASPGLPSNQIDWSTAPGWGTPGFNPAGQYQTQPGAAAQGGFLSNLFTGGGRDNVGSFGMIGDMAGGFTDRLGLTNYGLAGQQGGGGGMFGGMGGIGGLAAAGIPAYLLGKMAYDEAKADKGVPLTPLTTMGPTGRYNIEAEIARRIGTQSPNPIEYGLLPRGTIPTLSGGQPAAQGIAPLAADPGYDMTGLFR